MWSLESILSKLLTLNICSCSEIRILKGILLAEKTGRASRSLGTGVRRDWDSKIVSGGSLKPALTMAPEGRNQFRTDLSIK